MDSGGDRYSTAGMGRHWTLIPGPAFALIDTLGLEMALLVLHRFKVHRDTSREG